MRRFLCIAALAYVLAGCAGDPARLGDAQVRPADRPECLVSSSTEGLPRGQASGASHERCHPGDRLEWSSERRDTIKPDFRVRGDD
ncbi:MAG TPA: hypothetical protein VFF91_11920 [Pseudoxanthomonas sp.]|nr:hypothetical protein [Pseudoxanthomonas sp.]